LGSAGCRGSAAFWVVFLGSGFFGSTGLVSAGLGVGSDSEITSKVEVLRAGERTVVIVRRGEVRRGDGLTRALGGISLRGRTLTFDRRRFRSFRCSWFGYNVFGLVYGFRLGFLFYSI